jgi:hypothetical protein
MLGVFEHGIAGQATSHPAACAAMRALSKAPTALELSESTVNGQQKSGTVYWQGTW